MTKDMAQDPEATANGGSGSGTITNSIERAWASVRARPGDAAALRSLGSALRSAGQIAEAEEAEMEAVRASARHPMLAEAAAAIVQHRLPAAERALRTFLGRFPDDAAALSMLAEVANRAGIYSEAESLLRRTLELAPAYGEVRLNLAKVLVRRDRLDDAVTVLDDLLRRDPNHIGAVRFKGSVLGQIGDYDRAIALYESHLERFSNSALVWMSYGHVLKTVGRLEDSLVAYRTSLRLQPELGEAWWSIANLKTVTLTADDVARMEAGLASRTTATNRLHLHFALGRAYEDAKGYERSFRHYAEGNRLRRQMLPHDAQMVSEEVRRSKAVFTTCFFSDREGQGDPSSDPIFILGMPRAGSTLIEQILSSHSMVEGTSELPYLPAIVRGLVAERWQESVSYPELLVGLAAEEIASLGAEYLRRAARHRKTGRPFFIDKLPNNWSDIGFIHLILPNARIIDARRHPLACGFSCFKQHFAQGQSFSYALDDLGRFYRDYVDLTDHFDRTLPGRVHRVIHEQLVNDPEAEIRRLLGYLGLSFEPACLRFYDNDRAVRTASSEQVRRPITREGIDQWRHYEPWLGPLKAELGSIVDCYPETPDPL